MSDEAADTAFPLIDGVSQEQWNYWHSHPVSRLVRKYLRDYSEALEQTALARWKAGELELSAEHEIKSRIVQLGEIEILKFEDVKEFYDVPSAQGASEK